VNVSVVQHYREEIHIIGESDRSQKPEDGVPVDPSGRFQFHSLIRTSSCTTITQHHQTAANTADTTCKDSSRV